MASSNNKFIDCPALMADGRAFTDYRSSCEVNNDLRSGQTNSLEYRNYLINNATSLLNTQQGDMEKKLSCGSCKNTDMGNNLQSCDNGVCSNVNVPTALMKEIGSDAKIQGSPYLESQNNEPSGFNL